MTTSAAPGTRTPDTRTTTYGDVLRTAYVLRLLTGAVVGHLPVAMAPLAILLAVRAAGGTMHQAGLLAAAYGLTAAIGQPLWGRMLDRRGHIRTLTLTATVSTAAFAALAAMNPVTYPAAAVAITALAGLFTPPLEAALRVLWPAVAPQPGQQRAALALDACAQELVFIAGPLLVLALDATGGSGLVLGATTLLGLFGTLLFATTRPSRQYRPAPTKRADWLGPLRAPGPRILAAALLGAGVALGALNVTALTLAERHHAPELSTLIPAALAVGSLTGGLLYGRRAWPGSPAGQLLGAATGLCIGTLPILTVSGPIGAVTSALLPGVFLAPLLVASFSSLDHLAPRGTLGEASAWLIACLGLGQAAGTALAGAAGDDGPLGPAAVTVTGAALAVLVFAATRRRLAEHARIPDLATAEDTDREHVHAC
ncbi:MFS transporter [Streptomyces sp. NPDC020800]|uniref:MFS transporter n=1 Tax=Streptomyces sp. NPDC020800 TaxID=3365092 RepID=UPI0037A75191